MATNSLAQGPAWKSIFRYPADKDADEESKQSFFLKMDNHSFTYCPVTRKKKHKFIELKSADA